MQTLSNKKEEFQYEYDRHNDSLAQRNYQTRQGDKGKLIVLDWSFQSLRWN